MRRTSVEVVHTTDVLGALATLAVERREREFRFVRWIMRGDRDAQRSATNVTAGIDSAFGRLRELLGDDRALARHLSELAAILQLRGVAVADTSPPLDTDLALEAAEAFGDSAEVLLAGIRNRQVALLQVQRAEATRVETLWRRWMLAGTGTALLVLMLAAWSLHAHDRARADAMQLVAFSEARFRAAAEGGFDAFLLLHDVRGSAEGELDMRIVDLNQRAALLVGVSREELLGRSWRDLEHTFCADDDDFLVKAGMVMSAGKAREEVLMQRRGERPRWLRRLMVPTNSGLAVSCRDITEERDLRDQLAHSQKLDALGRMATGVAHDFNNILTVLRSECDLILAESHLPQQTRMDIHEMARAVDRAASLTQRLLAFSRKQVSAPRAIAVDLAIEDMRVFLIRMLPRSILLEVDAAPNLEPIVIDPVHFDQILLNLTANARDAMPEGGRLNIRADLMHVRDTIMHQHGSIAPGRWIRIRVADEGCGMSDSVLQRLFEPFFTTKAQGRGTGLGLATVHGAVVQAGGHVTVDSAPGQGTMFTLYFPAQPHAERGPTLVTTSFPAITAGGGKILIAEDEPAVRSVMERILKRAGYQVIAAPSGEEAMQLFARHLEEIDALVTDMVMPGMNGQELAARVTHVNPDLPVLFVSGYVGDAAQIPREIVESGRFLQKPFTADELVERLRRLGRT